MSCFIFNLHFLQITRLNYCLARISRKDPPCGDKWAPSIRWMFTCASLQRDSSKQEIQIHWGEWLLLSLTCKRAKGTIYLESFARDTYAKTPQPRLWRIGDVSQDRQYTHHLLVQISHINDSKDIVIYTCRLSDYQVISQPRQNWLLLSNLNFLFLLSFYSAPRFHWIANRQVLAA